MISVTRKEQILKFLDKNYRLTKEKQIIRKHDNRHEWGFDIVKSVTKTLGVNFGECIEIIKEWANLSEEEWDLVFRPRTLQTTWSPELTHDISVFDAEGILIELMCENLYQEIAHPILINRQDWIKSSDNLISIMYCLGYKLSPTYYNEITFTPYKLFIAIREDEILEARENNPVWQEWLREQNQ